jgi:transglutaminase-like putative cysteine protease
MRSLCPVACRLGLAIALAVAWPSDAAAERRLHERVLRPDDEAGPLVEQAAPGTNPAAIRLPRLEIPEPADAAGTNPGERAFQPVDRDPAVRALRQYRPDLDTGRTPTLPAYYPTFTPSVAPYKRLTALDRVGPDYALGISSTELTEVVVGGEASDDRDLFWGSVVVDLVPGQPIPIPSVAPDARILSVRTRPARRVGFFRDAADNFSVVGSEAGETRIIFVTDAPASYFGNPMPPEVRSSDVPVALRPSLPPNVARAAAEVARRLGLDPEAPVARNLTRLITYLRSFRVEPMDAPAGVDPYLALALGRRGVCRHRAFVFVVTAQGLGLPARFVSNEVHAFAEVWVPTLGWLRVDLGGEGPLSMASEPAARHEPRAPDPFPWPHDQPQPRVASPSIGGRAPGHDGPPAERPGAGGDAGPGQGQGDVLDPSRVSMGEGPADQGSEAAPTPGAAGEPAPRPAGDVRVVLERHTAHVVRGEALTVSGHVESGHGEPAADVRVLVRIVRGAGLSFDLGRAVSGPDGAFRANLAVPRSVPTGDYSITARAER